MKNLDITKYTLPFITQLNQTAPIIESFGRSCLTTDPAITLQFDCLNSSDNQHNIEKLLIYFNNFYQHIVFEQIDLTFSTCNIHILVTIDYHNIPELKQLFDYTVTFNSLLDPRLGRDMIGIIYTF